MSSVDGCGRPVRGRGLCRSHYYDVTDTDALAFIGGFVAAEGCFTRGAPTRDFRFSIGVGAEDEPLVAWIRAVLGVGRVHHYARRQDHFDDEAAYAVGAREGLIEVLVPFMDEWLPPSYKRQQYEAWRADLLAGSKDHETS